MNDTKTDDLESYIMLGNFIGHVCPEAFLADTVDTT